MDNERGFINRGAGIGGFNNFRKKINLALRRRGYDPRLFTERIGSKKSASPHSWPTTIRNNFRDVIMDWHNGANPVDQAQGPAVSTKKQYQGPALTGTETPDFPKDSDFQATDNLDTNPEEAYG